MENNTPYTPHDNGMDTGAIYNDARERGRVFQRELFLAMATSDLAEVEHFEKPKIELINPGAVLYEVSHFERAFNIAVAFDRGKKLPPIDVDAYRLHHLVYYIVNDGNHRAAAAVYLWMSNIKARVRSVTDISLVRFRVGFDNRLFVSTSDPGVERVTDVLVEDGVQRAVFTVFYHFQTYDHIRKQEIEQWPEEQSTVKAKGSGA